MFTNANNPSPGALLHVYLRVEEADANHQPYAHGFTVFDNWLHVPEEALFAGTLDLGPKHSTPALGQSLEAEYERAVEGIFLDYRRAETILLWKDEVAHFAEVTDIFRMTSGAREQYYAGGHSEECTSRCR